MEDLWSLIQDEAEAIEGYAKFLDSDFAKTEEAGPIVATVKRIMASERDHMDALNVLCTAMCKDKAETGVTDMAKNELREYRDSKKIIK